MVAKHSKCRPQIRASCANSTLPEVYGDCNFTGFSPKLQIFMAHSYWRLSHRSRTARSSTLPTNIWYQCHCIIQSASLISYTAIYRIPHFVGSYFYTPFREVKFLPTLTSCSEAVSEPFQKQPFYKKYPWVSFMKDLGQFSAVPRLFIEASSATILERFLKSSSVVHSRL